MMHRLTPLLLVAVCLSLGCASERVLPDESEQDDQIEVGEEGWRCRTALDCNDGLFCHLNTPTDGVCFVPDEDDLDHPMLQFGPKGQPPPPYYPRGEAGL